MVEWRQRHGVRCHRSDHRSGARSTAHPPTTEPPLIDLRSPKRSPQIIDLHETAVEFIAVALGDGPPARAWSAIAELGGCVGAFRPIDGEFHALFARRATSRDAALRELEIDLCDAVDVDIAGTSRW